MQVLLLRVADRFGKGVRTSPRDALLADAAPRELRGRAYGFHQAMDNAGAIIGPLTATALLGLGLTLRNVFLITAVPGVLTMCALVFGVKEPPRETATPGKPLGEIEHTRARSMLVRCIVAVVIFGLGNSSDAFLLLRAQQCGIALRWVPLVWMAHNATKALLSTWGGALSDRFDRRRVIVVGWAIYGGVYLCFGVASAPWHIWALFVAYGVYYSLTEGAMKALVADIAPAHARGRAFGWYNAAVGIVALPASLGFGALADHFGARVPFTVSALLAASAACWLLVAVPRSS
jgi:MFS family permease